MRVVRPRLPGGIPVGGRFVEPPLWAARLYPVLRREYAASRPDLIHAHCALPDGFAAATFARGRIPLVLTVWGSDIFRRRQAVTRDVLRWTLRQAAAVICVSAELADAVLELGADPGRVQVNPGGVPYRDIIPYDEARAALGVPPGATVVLWVGGLVDVKQPVEAVEAFARWSEGSGVLIIVGDGPLRRQVADEAARWGVEGSVRMTGYLPRCEVWRWQCAADVLVNSSASEGTPLSVLEALGAGTVVAGYPLPGVRSAVDQVGGGSMAAVASPEALASAIGAAQTRTSSRELLALAARDAFSIERDVRGIEGVYDAVVGY